MKPSYGSFEELKVDWNTLRPVDLTKARVKVEMNLNVVLPTLLEVIDGAWFFTVAVSVVGGEEDEQLKPVLTHCRSELASTGGGMWQYPLQSRRTHGEAKTSEGNNCRPPSQVSISNFNGITNWADFSKEEVAHAVGDLGPFEEEDPSLPKALLVKSFEARLCEGKACTGGSPFHSTNLGPYTPIFDKLAHLDGILGGRDAATLSRCWRSRGKTLRKLR